MNGWTDRQIINNGWKEIGTDRQMDRITQIRWKDRWRDRKQKGKDLMER